MFFMTHKMTVFLPITQGFLFVQTYFGKIVMIAEQNWLAENMEHRDTKAQSFYFLREQSLWRKGLLYGLCLLLIYFSVVLCLCVQ